MKFMTLALTLLTVAFTSNAFASSKVCFGSTKDTDTKGIVMTAEITAESITLKTIKGDYYNGTYPVLPATVRAHDGVTYMQFNGGGEEYQNNIMVNPALLNDGTQGLIQIRARGEGFFNSVFYCRDSK